MPGPAATISHMHTCPMFSGSSPHVGGPIIGPGVPTVLIGGKPAAVMGDQCTCAGPPDVIVEGVATVLIGGKPAATMGSKTAHGGLISIGDPTVLIGTGCSAPTTVMPISQIPFPEISFVDKILGKNKQALANQAALREEEQGEPEIYGIQWVAGEQTVRESHVFYEVTVRARVRNISDGEEITFSIKKPVNNNNGATSSEEEDIIELSGTVQDKMVEVTWEIEKTQEESE